MQNRSFLTGCALDKMEAELKNQGQSGTGRKCSKREDSVVFESCKVVLALADSDIAAVSVWLSNRYWYWNRWRSCRGTCTNPENDLIERKKLILIFLAVSHRDLWSLFLASLSMCESIWVNMDSWRRSYREKFMNGVDLWTTAVHCLPERDRVSESICIGYELWTVTWDLPRLSEKWLVNLQHALEASFILLLTPSFFLLYSQRHRVGGTCSVNKPLRRRGAQRSKFHADSTRPSWLRGIDLDFMMKEDIDVWDGSWWYVGISWLLDHYMYVLTIHLQSHA